MNPVANLIAPEAEARIRTTIGSISGTTLLRFTATLPPNDNASRLINVCIKLFGWSPTLNRVKIHWRITIDMDQDAEAQAGQLLQKLDGVLKVQRRRFAEGMKLGKAAPFGTGDMHNYEKENTEWGHIFVDRGLAALMEKYSPGSFASEVSDSVFDLHQNDHGERSGLEEIYMDETTCEKDEDLGMHALIGRQLLHDIRIADDVLYDGMNLRLKTQLPETILTAAVGRRLGELVDVPQEIAWHKISGYEIEYDGLIIVVKPHFELCSVLLQEIALGRIQTPSMKEPA